MNEFFNKRREKKEEKDDGKKKWKMLIKFTAEDFNEVNRTGRADGLGPSSKEEARAPAGIKDANAPKSGSGRRGGGGGGGKGGERRGRGGRGERGRRK